jgi:hypothetical protein
MSGYLVSCFGRLTGSTAADERCGARSSKFLVRSRPWRVDSTGTCRATVRDEFPGGHELSPSSPPPVPSSREEGEAMWRVAASILREVGRDQRQIDSQLTTLLLEGRYEKIWEHLLAAWYPAKGRGIERSLQGRYWGYDEASISSACHMAAYRAMKSYDPDKGSFRAWARRKMRGAVMTLVRNEQRHQQSEPVEDIDAFGLGMDDAGYETAELQIDLSRLPELPPRWRTGCAASVRRRRRRRCSAVSPTSGRSTRSATAPAEAPSASGHSSRAGKPVDRLAPPSGPT